jgi:hypothetical protein
MTDKSSIKVLEAGVTLRACLTIKDQSKLSEEKTKHLMSWESARKEIATEHFQSWTGTSDLSLVEVSIVGPTAQHAKKFDTKTGGLWLLTVGPKLVGLQSSQISLPKAASTDPVNSLNHAFTKLSEAYEPWRISHTGSVYQRFLYKETDGRWYPLELLRNATLAKKEQEIAYQLWQDFLQRMSARDVG